MDVDPDEVFEDVQRLTAFNELVRTRTFYDTATSDFVGFAPIRFTGPGNAIVQSDLSVYWLVCDYTRPGAYRFRAWYMVWHSGPQCLL